MRLMKAIIKRSLPVCSQLTQAGLALQDPRAFRQDMTDMFGKLDLDTISEYTSQIINDMMDSIRKHQVKLLSSTHFCLAGIKQPVWDI